MSKVTNPPARVAPAASKVAPASREANPAGSADPSGTSVVCAEDAEVRAASCEASLEAPFEIAMMVDEANNCSSTSLAEGEPAIPDPSLRRSEFFGSCLAALPLSAALDFLIASNTRPISHLSVSDPQIADCLAFVFRGRSGGPQFGFTGR